MSTLTFNKQDPYNVSKARVYARQRRKEADDKLLYDILITRLLTLCEREEYGAIVATYEYDDSSSLLFYAIDVITRICCDK